MTRFARWLAPALLVTTCAACAIDRASHPLERTQIWHRYEDLADERALAIAGDPEDVWVGGAAGGQPTPRDAEREALAECARQRARRRLQAPCVLYAEGERIATENFRRRRSWP